MALACHPAPPAQPSLAALESSPPRRRRRRRCYLRRSSGDDLSARRLLTELLIQMTAAASRPGCLLFVLAATNRPQDCDPALLRRWGLQWCRGLVLAWARRGGPARFSEIGWWASQPGGCR